MHSQNLGCNGFSNKVLVIVTGIHTTLEHIKNSKKYTPFRFVAFWNSDEEGKISHLQTTCIR